MAKKHLIPAAGYARRSTDLQDRSIPDQKAYVEQWAKDHGYRVVRWYVDDAISGTSTRGRDDFGAMLQAAENGRDFDCVLCYDISRFSRGGTNETGYYLHRFKLAGVNVLFPADGIPEGDEGELIQGVKSWQARQYSVRLARDTIRGQISNIRERRSAPGGVPPYGYDKQHLTADGKVLRTLRWLPDGSKQEFGPDGKPLRVIEPGVAIKKAKSDVIRYVPSTPERVEVIRRIFAWCVAGYGYHYIASTLNDEGIPSPQGTPWNTARIGKIIKNPAYRGAVAWNRRTMGSLFGVDGEGKLRPKTRKGWHQNDESDWIIAENVHEPLVSAEKFEKAVRAIAKRSTLGGRARSVNRSLLASLMVCTKCGHHFVLRRDRRWPGPHGEGYRAYSDAGYHRGGKAVCKFTNLPADALEAFVLGKVKQVLLGDHATTGQAIDAFVEAVLNHRKPAKTSKHVERGLEAVNRKIKATLSMLADPAFDGLDELRSTLADLKAKRDALQAQTAPKPAKPEVTERELRQWAAERFAAIDRIITERSSDLAARQLVEAFVDRIEIDPDAKRGVLYLPAGAFDAFLRGSTRVALGDFMGAHEWCQPAGTQVLTPDGVVPIETLHDGDRVVSFSPRSSAVVGFKRGFEIRRTARDHDGTLYGVRAGKHTTWCTEGHPWTVKLLPEAGWTWCVYLMRRGTWWRVGKSRLITSAGFGLKHRLAGERADEAWILSTHRTNFDALAAEQVIVSAYGIPSIYWDPTPSRTREMIASPMDHDNGKQSLDPTSLEVADAARLLSRVGEKPITEQALEADLAAGAPTNPDGTINLVHFAAWLLKEAFSGE